MSTSTKTPNSIRQGGPGASHENAKAPLEGRSQRRTTRSATTAASPAEVASTIHTTGMTRPEKAEAGEA